MPASTFEKKKGLASLLLTPYFLMFSWQARRDSNPQPSDLESDALAVRATGLREALYITRLRLRRKGKTNPLRPAGVIFGRDPKCT